MRLASLLAIAERTCQPSNALKLCSSIKRARVRVRALPAASNYRSCLVLPFDVFGTHTVRGWPLETAGKTALLHTLARERGKTLNNNVAPPSHHLTGTKQRRRASSLTLTIALFRSLVENGMPSEQARMAASSLHSTITSLSPSTSAIDVGDNLAVLIELLGETGTWEAICHCPPIVLRSAQDIKATIERIESLMLDASFWRRVVKAPQVLLLSPMDVDKKLAQLRSITKHCPFIIEHDPNVLCRDTRGIRENATLLRTFGYSDYILDIAKQSPGTFLQPPEGLKSLLDYYNNKVSRSLLVKSLKMNPSLLFDPTITKQIDWLERRGVGLSSVLAVWPPAFANTLLSIKGAYKTLRSLGIEKEEIGEMYSQYPRAIAMPEKVVRKCLKTLEDATSDVELACEYIKRWPPLMWARSEVIKENIVTLKSPKSVFCLNEVLQYHPKLLTKDPSELKDKFRVFQALDESGTLKFYITNAPVAVRIALMSQYTWELTNQLIELRLVGLTDKEIVRACRTQPQILYRRLLQAQSKVAYLRAKGLRKNIIMSHTEILSIHMKVVTNAMDYLEKLIKDNNALIAILRTYPELLTMEIKDIESLVRSVTERTA